MASKKAGGSSRNGRDSAGFLIMHFNNINITKFVYSGKRLGVKKFGGY
jgi:ribosomal protein L27